MTSRRFTVLVPSMSNVLWQRVCLGEGSENSVSSRVWVFFLQGIFLHGGIFFGRFRAFDVKMNSDYAIDTPRFLVHNISRCSSSSESLHLSISEYQEAWTKTWSHLDIDQLQPERRGCILWGSIEVSHATRERIWLWGSHLHLGVFFLCGRGGWTQLVWCFGNEGLKFDTGEGISWYLRCSSP